MRPSWSALAVRTMTSVKGPSTLEPLAGLGLFAMLMALVDTGVPRLCRTCLAHHRPGQNTLCARFDSVPETEVEAVLAEAYGPKRAPPSAVERIRQRLHEAVTALPNRGWGLSPTDLATDLAPLVAEMVCAAERGAHPMQVLEVPADAEPPNSALGVLRSPESDW